MPSSTIDHASAHPLSSLSELVPGVPAFVSDGSMDSDIHNQAWKQAVSSVTPSVLLTVSSWELSPSMVAPGVFVGKDILVEELSGHYRVAVSSVVARFRYWFVFRCFVYPDVPGMELSRRVGYLRVPTLVVGRFKFPRDVGGVEAKGKVHGSMQSVSKSMRRLVRLLFPVRDRATGHGHP